MIPIRKLALAVAGLAVGSLPAMAEEYEVQMLGLGSDGKFMVFEPAFLKIEPGDTVTFVPTTGRHNSEPIPGMLPEEAEPWKGKIQEEITVTFDVEGVYGYMCEPHYSLMGMVGLIQVGDDLANLKEARAVEHPNMAGRRMAELFKQVGSGDRVKGTVEQKEQNTPSG